MTRKITSRELTEPEQRYLEFIESYRTLILSTLSHKGHPEVSYAPFIRGDNGNFYIFISELAHHTGNLMAVPECSLFLGQPEQEQKNIFACERVVFNCRASEVARDDPAFTKHLDQMQAVFGDTLKLLRGLRDFHLFELVPLSGQYTVGFANAFTINADGSLVHRTG